MNLRMNSQVHMIAVDVEESQSPVMGTNSIDGQQSKDIRHAKGGDA